MRRAAHGQRISVELTPPDRLKHPHGEGRVPVAAALNPAHHPLAAAGQQHVIGEQLLQPATAGQREHPGRLLGERRDGHLETPDPRQPAFALALQVAILDRGVLGEVGLEHQREPVDDAGLDAGPGRRHRRGEACAGGRARAQIDLGVLVVEAGKNAPFHLDAIRQRLDRGGLGCGCSRGGGIAVLLRGCLIAPAGQAQTHNDDHEERSPRSASPGAHQGPCHGSTKIREKEGQSPPFRSYTSLSIRNGQ